MATVDDVLAINPCDPYTDRNVVEQLFNGKTSCDIADFLAMDIPSFCKLSVILRTGLVSEQDQAVLKELYVARINRLLSPRFWREANQGNCEQAAHAAQLYAIQMSHDNIPENRKHAADQEASWQLQKLIEVLND